MRKMILPFMLALPMFLSGYTSYPEMTDVQKERFHQSLDSEVRAAEKRLRDKYEEIRKGDHFINASARVEHDALKGSLDTKRTLVGNFRNAPSTRSPRVREELLKVLKQKFISPDDLYELDDVVKQERTKVAPPPK